ncbi:rod-binding protein [Sulfitobacter sp. JB4-11]|uniref:rod-binding protein n=1 Tax=Sulfitobacter rhodophyticola TaxID=3238304 RepID=UPI0035125F92
MQNVQITPANVGTLLQQTRAATEDSKSAEASKEFEAVFLGQFVDEMLKTAGATAFGDEHQAEMWRSFMSEAVAKHLVEQGGVGLSGSVSQMIGAYTDTASDKT